jgi:hypothetical protein
MGVLVRKVHKAHRPASSIRLERNNETPKAFKRLTFPELQLKAFLKAATALAGLSCANKTSPSANAAKQCPSKTGLSAIVRRGPEHSINERYKSSVLTITKKNKHEYQMLSQHRHSREEAASLQFACFSSATADTCVLCDQ